MYDKGIFVFGSKIFPLEKQDAISPLPLELSWKIFSYLDNTSLRNCSKACKKWKRIILANRQLRSRLNQFELILKLGSESLTNFYRKNKRRLRKEKKKKFLQLGECSVSTRTVPIKSKRGGDDLVIYTKRYKLF